MRVRTNITAGQGLGDAVADMTQLTGIDQLADVYEQVTGKDCGCSKRQEQLNELFPDVNSLFTTLTSSIS